MNTTTHNSTLVQVSKVKAWRDETGYGFIFNPTPGGPDIFVHYSGVIGKGRKTLRPGDEVQFNIAPTDKGLSAINVLVRRPHKSY